jgi:hypothetical protein
MGYLKYLPLLGIIAQHPTIVSLFQQLLTEVQPHVQEINQLAGEIEAALQKINATPGAPT